jgi:uncharacterized protein YegL
MTLQQILQEADVKKTVAMDVCLAIDCSGSMQNEFEDGTVAKIVTMIQEFAKQVDDDGKIETVGFNTQSTKVNTLKFEDNISQFISRHYRPAGGTSYADAISNLLDTVDHNLPSMVFVLTDGECNDEAKTRSVLLEASTKHPSKYIHFIRAGTDALNIKFIEQVANELPNVGYSDVPNPRVNSDVFFKSLVTNELARFLNNQSV